MRHLEVIEGSIVLGDTVRKSCTECFFCYNRGCSFVACDSEEDSDMYREEFLGTINYKALIRCNQ